VSDYQRRAGSGWPAQPPDDGYGQGYGNGQDYGPTARLPQPTRRLRRRRHPFAWLLVVVAALLVILGIGDQVAKGYAQNRVAQQIETQSELSAKPSVTIEGWPFLTQVAAHDLKEVDISANNVTANTGKLPFSFTAKATGVHLNSSFNGATVDHINGQATVPFSSVATLFPVEGVTLSADPADGPDAVKANVGIAGTVTGTVKLASPGKITVTLNSASGLAALFSQLSGNAITITIPQLPAGLVVNSVSVTSQGIVATASASNTTLTE
jgi:LmeA-like phospholipid-binding